MEVYYKSINGDSDNDYLFDPYKTRRKNIVNYSQYPHAVHTERDINIHLNQMNNRFS